MGSGNRMLHGRPGRNQFDISEQDIRELGSTFRQRTPAPDQPSLEAIQALDGRIVAMLTEEEMQTLLFYRNRGRMFGVSISIIDEASSEHPEEAGNPQQAYQILRHGNSRIRVTLTPRNP